jgi:hypothetical protein
MVGLGLTTDMSFLERSKITVRDGNRILIFLFMALINHKFGRAIR